MTAQPYTPEELEQVRQRDAEATKDCVEHGYGHSAPHHGPAALRDRPRLLATLAEREAQTIHDADYIKNLELRFNVMFETATDLRAQLTASHNAALERASGAICFGCAHGWPTGYHKDDRGPNKLLMHYTEGNAPGEPGHDCKAQPVRALMTKE